MVNEPEFIIDGVSQSDYESASSGFIEIPTATKGGSPKEGDSIMLEFVAGKAEWKQMGVSMTLPITITSEGVNKGKTYEIYPAVSHDALSILKDLCKKMGVESKVITFNANKQMVIKPYGFEGGKAVINFTRTWTQPQQAGKKPSLVAKASSTDVYALTSGGSKAQSVGI